MTENLNPIKWITTAFNVKKTWDRFVLDDQCDEIIDKYELEGCDSEQEFWSKFNRLQASEKTKFLKCNPEIHEYLEHARQNPGVPYSSRKYLS
jgi:hypothetical protein